MPSRSARPLASLAALASCALVLVAPSPLSAASPAGADARFEALAGRYVAEFRLHNPVAATQLGDHRSDGELDDMSAAGRARRLAWNRGLLAELAGIERTALGRANQVDAAILENQLRYAAWSEETYRDWSWDPLVYTQLTGQALYGLLAREFAPLPERLQSVTRRLEQLPRLLAQTRANLEPARVPAIHAETAVKQNRGLLSLVDELVVPALPQLPSAQRARLERAIARARAAVTAHQQWLERQLLPNARGDFRIGRELFDQKLGFALMSPLSRAEIRRRAEAEVLATRARMYEVARTVLAGRDGAPPTPPNPTPAAQQAAIKAALELASAERPARDGVVELARATLRETTEFVRRSGFVTLPDEPLEIILMPEFQRGVAIAYCDSPGPLDKGQRTFYAVSPIPDDWTGEQVDSFLREYNARSIANLTIHEAMPGHYVQIAHSNRYPSVLRAMLGSGPFIEGWAVYTERVMQDQGFRAADPLMRLVQLKWYLRSITNAIIDSAIHVDGMTRDQAMQLMTETGFQEEREAAGKWVRAQLSSTQLSTYFVGYQEHADMRAEAERRAGAGFDLRRYHDGVLAFGSPPVRFVRELLFDEPIRDGPPPAFPGTGGIRRIKSDLDATARQGALVTGSSSGIGLGVARAFAREGAAVVINHPGPAEAAAAAEAVRTIEAAGGRAVAIQADVSAEADCERLVEGCVAALGRVDILVNNAGIAAAAPVEQIPVAQWDRVIAVHLRGTFLMTRLVLPRLYAQGWGRIINTASQLADKGAPGFAHYTAAKGAIISFTRSVALEIGTRAVRINAVAPGATRTPILADVPPALLEQVRAAIPTGRIADVDDIVPTYVFLASEDGRHYQGQTLSPNGGDQFY